MFPWMIEIAIPNRSSWFKVHTISQITESSYLHVATVVPFLYFKSHIFFSNKYKKRNNNTVVFKIAYKSRNLMLLKKKKKSDEMSPKWENFKNFFSPNYF